MKLAMKLRTRLFLSISALITVALLGLLLGLVSVMQMARTQESLIQHNFAILDLGLKLRQNLGDQLVLMTGSQRNEPELEKTQSQFEELLEQGSVQDTQQEVRSGFEKTKGDYQNFIKVWKLYGNDPRGIRGTPQLSESFDTLRNGLLSVHRTALENISNAEINSRDRALWIAGLLGLVGLAVLCIGFVTAHGIARRFGAPIEALAKAADRIGEGDYEVTLPISSAAEMNLLTRRFGIMAEALRQHQATNVDELLAGQQRLQAVLDSIDDGLLMIDRQGHLEHLNPVAQRQLGWDESRLGHSLGEALGRPELDEQLHLVLRGGTLERAPEDLAIEIDGESRLLTYSMTPVSHTKGHILGAVMVLHDVTEQRAFERVRSEFVLRASHELRTPVTGMHMAFGLLQERLHFAPESREADLLNTVTEEMQRLMQLINDLLNFSRYQNGLQKLKLAPCSIETLLEEAKARFEDQALEQDIVLMLDVQEPMPRLHADQSQLERVLDNLLDNALRHTPPKGLI
ncbi:PAS domain-containing protein, partial [Pseudomonas syringae]